MNESNIYSKCSEESLSQIATTCLEFPSAKTVLDALLHTVTFDSNAEACYFSISCFPIRISLIFV